MSKQRVLIFTNLYPSLQEPERGIFISQLAERLKQNVEIQVVCPLPWFPKTNLFKGKLKSWRKIASVPSNAIINDIRVSYPRYVIFPKISDTIHAMLMFVGIKRQIHRICSIWSPNVILSLWIYPDAVCAVLIGRQKNIPVIIGALGCDINRDMKRPFISSQIRYALEKADHITTVSEALKQVITQQSIDENKISVISTGVNKTLFKPRNQSECRSMLNVTIDHKIITVVGQLVPVKDHKTLLKALAQLVELQDVPPLSVYFVGEGPLESELRELTLRLGIANMVHFIGQQPHDQIPVWICASDVMCLPSIREGRPNAIMETLSCGVPVVASDVGGIPELVQEKNGFLFQPGDYEELANALMKCFNKKWDKDEISQTANHLTWENSAKKYLKIIDTITRED